MAEVWKAMPEKDKLVGPFSLINTGKVFEIYVVTILRVHLQSCVLCLLTCAGLEAESSVSAAQTEQS